jgi:hypothetical protein
VEAVATPAEVCGQCSFGQSPHQDWHDPLSKYHAIGDEMSRRAKVIERDTLRVIPDNALVGYGASLRRMLASSDELPDFLRELAEDWLQEAEREWRWRQKAARLGGDAVMRVAGAWRDRVERVKEWASLSQLIAYENAGARPTHGGGWECCCPFHDDSHPSLHIDMRKGVWICRACNVGGDAITYVQLRHRCSFVEAVEFLEQQFGVLPPLPPRRVLDM